MKKPMTVRPGPPSYSIPDPEPSPPPMPPVPGEPRPGPPGDPVPEPPTPLPPTDPKPFPPEPPVMVRPHTGSVKGKRAGSLAVAARLHGPHGHPSEHDQMGDKLSSEHPGIAA